MKYKIKYIELKNNGNQIGGNKKANIIIIVGYAGSGKSYLADQYAKNNYFVIHGDEVIRDNLMSNGNDGKYFGIYAEEIPEGLIQSKNKFIKIIKRMISKHENIVIEGQFKNIDMINEMVGKKNDYTIIFVKPKSIKSYIEHLTNRFVEDPANYARLGFIANLDGENNRVGLNDYIKNGITGKYIKKLIKDAAEARYYKHQELLEFYEKKYKNLIVKLT